MCTGVLTGFLVRVLVLRLAPIHTHEFVCVCVCVCERERERERFIRNNLHDGVVSGAAR